MLHIKVFTFNPFMENTYVLYNDEKNCCIIDPGCFNDNEQKQLKNFIEKNALKPVYLINTHCHIDHVFGLQFVSDTWQLPVHIHEIEEKVLAVNPQLSQMYEVPFKNYFGEKKYLKEGDEIILDNDKLTVLFTPGHSPGSISFYSKENNLLISGDVLFSGSIGRTDLPGGDYATLENSIKTKLYTLPDETKVYSGHGGCTSIGFEKINNPFVKAD